MAKVLCPVSPASCAVLALRSWAALAPCSAPVAGLGVARSQKSWHVLVEGLVEPDTLTSKWTGSEVDLVVLDISQLAGCGVATMSSTGCLDVVVLVKSPRMRIVETHGHHL